MRRSVRAYGVLGAGGCCLPLAMLLIAVLCHPAWGLPSRVHAILAYEAARMPGVPAEMATPEAVGNPDDPTGADLESTLCEGAFDEDYDRVPRTIRQVLDLSNPDLIYGQGSHFWNPQAGPDGGQLLLFNPPPPQNAWQRGRMLYDQAVAAYPGDPGRARYLLGRVVHLLTDMSTPAHTHLDPHVSDGLASALDVEVLAKDCYERYLGWHYVTGKPAKGIVDPTGRLRFEGDLVQGPIEPVQPVYLVDGGYPELGDLYRLFHSMATYTARWDSNDADGTGPAGIGGGSLRWRWKIDVPFVDAASIEVRLVDARGNQTPVEPIATVGGGRILLPDISYDGARWIEVSHDGTSERLRPRRIEQMDQVADADCARIAQDLMPVAIAHTAALYRLFWRDTHPDDPAVISAVVPGDIDGDGFVTILDLLAAVNAFGTAVGQAGYDPRVDVDASGGIDMTDLLRVIASFGQTR